MKPAVSRVAIIAAVATAGLIAGCGSEEDVQLRAVAQARAVAAALGDPLDRLGDAAVAARPSRRSSRVTLQAAADGAGDAIREARADLRDIEDTAPRAERRPIREYVDLLGDLEELTQALAAERLSVHDLEVSGERARQAIDDVQLDLPRVETAALAAAVRRSRRRKPVSEGSQAGAPVSSPADSPPAAADPTSYFDYYGPAFRARLPNGSGWSAPASSQPTPGKLFRTSVQGPDGLFAIIDYTPFEAATFGGDYSSKSNVGQTAFGSATRYVFQGGSLPECQRSTCIDYIINDVSSGEGFGVLAGGGSSETAAAVAQTIAESLVPTSIE